MSQSITMFYVQVRTKLDRQTRGTPGEGKSDTVV